MVGRVKRAQPPELKRPLHQWEKRALELNARGMPITQIASIVRVSVGRVYYFFSPKYRERARASGAKWRENNPTVYAQRIKERNSDRVRITIQLTVHQHATLVDYAVKLSRDPIEICRTAILDEIDYDP